MNKQEVVGGKRTKSREKKMVLVGREELGGFGTTCIGKCGDVPLLLWAGRTQGGRLTSRRSPRKGQGAFQKKPKGVRQTPGDEGRSIGGIKTKTSSVMRLGGGNGVPSEPQGSNCTGEAKPTSLDQRGRILHANTTIQG